MSYFYIFVGLLFVDVNIFSFLFLKLERGPWVAYHCSRLYVLQVLYHKQGLPN
jgi:hypothetical protein